MRLDRDSKLAVVRFVLELIKADEMVDIREIQVLEQLEQTYGLDRGLMAEARTLSVAEAINQIRALDAEALAALKTDLQQLACADRVSSMRESLLLLSLQYHNIALPDNGPEGGWGPYIIYLEGQCNESRHAELAQHAEWIQLLLDHYGLRFIYAEGMAARMGEMDEKALLKILGYLAPQRTDAEVNRAYRRMLQMTSQMLCQEVMAHSLQMTELRNIEPSLLLCTPFSLLLIPLQQQLVVDQIKTLTAHYDALVSPNQRMSVSDARAGSALPLTGYYQMFFNFLLRAEPHDCHLEVWPNKSEFEFPEAGRTLHLNQQEASLYTLILYCSCRDGQGLPLSYTPQQKKLEALYRNIYARKKMVDNVDIVYPDNLAPIRAKIEHKMREQLIGVDNLEEFIPRNEGRKGFYRVAAAPERIQVIEGLHADKVAILDYRF